MSVRDQNHPSSSCSNMFHHGLIKLLITQELAKVERSWSHVLFWGGFKVNLKGAEKRKRKRVVETSDSTETKPLSEYCYEKIDPEEITSAQLPEKEPGWENNENSNLGSVDKTQIVEEITSAQLPEEEINCIRMEVLFQVLKCKQSNKECFILKSFQSRQSLHLNLLDLKPNL